MAPLRQPHVDVHRASTEQGVDRMRFHHDGGTRLAQGPLVLPVATTLCPFCPLYQPCVSWIPVVGFARFRTARAFETLPSLPPPGRVTSKHRAVIVTQHKDFTGNHHTTHSIPVHSRSFLCLCQVVTVPRLIPIAHVVVNLRCVAYAFNRTYVTYELASSSIHSLTPTAEELQYLIDHLRAQAQLNENYAREERCLAAFLEATRAYHDIKSHFYPQTSALCLSFSPLILLFA